MHLTSKHRPRRSCEFLHSLWDACYQDGGDGFLLGNMYYTNYWRISQGSKSNWMSQRTWLMVVLEKHNPAWEDAGGRNSEEKRSQERVIISIGREISGFRLVDDPPGTIRASRRRMRSFTLENDTWRLDSKWNVERKSFEFSMREENV